MSELDSPVLRALTLLGGFQPMATALGGEDVTKQLVRSWVLSDQIPPAHWRAVCKLTGLTIEEFLDHAEARAKKKLDQRRSHKAESGAG